MADQTIRRKRARYREAQRWLREKTSDPGTRCILWPFARNQGGWAQCGNPRTSRVDGAYRVAWEMYHGTTWPAGLEARHSCGNGHAGCINPLHISPGTHAENGRDMIRDGRSNRGSNNGRSKLTEKSIAEGLQRVSEGETLRSVADDLGVSDVALGLAWRGKRWKHVNAPRATN